MHHLFSTKTPRRPNHVSSRCAAIRNLAVRLGAALLACGGVAAWQATTASASTNAPVCSTTSVANIAGGPAYYLFESNGAVFSCGGAPLYGSIAGSKHVDPVIGGASLPNASGYWIATSAGGVFAFGAAKNYGSAARLHLHSPIVSFAVTPDDKGYWLVSAAGNLFHFGDAKFFGSTVRDRRDGNVVSILSSPDGQGYWVVSDRGVVHAFGDAAPVGSLSLHSPMIVSAAASPDGRGLLLLKKNGGIANLGTSAFFGSLVHHRNPRPPIAIAPTTDGGGYLIALQTGNIYNFGDATFAGSLGTSPPRRPTGVVGIAGVSLTPPPPPASPAPVTVPAAPPVVSTPAIPHGLFGYDISNYQCASPGSAQASSALPPTASFAVLEVAGWLDSGYNSCLGSEANWATQAAGTDGAHYSLYMFVNAPDQSSAATALDATGPAGTCSTLASNLRPNCLAYNYGYGGANADYTYAASKGVLAPLWWLDVEGTNLSSSDYSNYSAGQFWSKSTSLNDATIQGAIDALHAHGITVGMYSSSVQYPIIAGDYVPTGTSQIPLWIAGVPWTSPPYSQKGLLTTSVLAGWCLGTSGYSTTPTDLFANGTPWLLQETPGTMSSPFGIDPNYSC